MSLCVYGVDPSLFCVRCIDGYQRLTLADVLVVLVRSNFRCCCVLDMLIGCLTLYPHTPCMYYTYLPPPPHLYSVYLVNSLRSVRLGCKCRPAAMSTNTLVSALLCKCQRSSKCDSMATTVVHKKVKPISEGHILCVNTYVYVTLHNHKNPCVCLCVLNNSYSASTA